MGNRPFIIEKSTLQLSERIGGSVLAGLQGTSQFFISLLSIK